MSSLFLWVPLHMTSIQYNQYWLAKTFKVYDEVFVYSWIRLLGDDSVILKIRINNTVYWCNKFEVCTPP